MKEDIKTVAELCFVKDLITEVYPTGIVSIVSDTFDLWKVISFILPELKNIILERDGKVVIRPDSGDPVKIICGDDKQKGSAKKGLIECLWDIFGGSVNGKGYKVLDSHIGAIYGDSITLDRCKSICQKLKDKGFASTNMVYGIGSYTYQYNTRDSFGFALKSTMCMIDGIQKNIYKNPKTDDGVKKSNKGVVAILKNEDGYVCIDELMVRDNVEDKMRDVFVDGKLFIDDSLAEIRERIKQ